MALPTRATIAYAVSLDHPELHLFHVTMQVSVEGRELDTALPAWNALYQIRDFADRLRNVEAICATLEAVPLKVEKIDKQDWHISSRDRCAPGEHNTFIIRYDILWNEPGPFDSQLDSHHAFLNLAEILMYLPTRRAEGATLQFADIPAGWQPAAALVLRSELNSYTAPSYDALVDAPVEIGKLAMLRWESDGVSVGVALDGKITNANRLESELREIAHYELQMMRDKPFESRPAEPDYLFIIHMGSGADVGGGGMEHRNSCTISGASVEEVAGIAAHEFFHAWNVKRIRPQALEPVDYSREQYTRALWFAEGVTNTYEDFALVRSGVWSKEQFYRDFAGQIDVLQSRPARQWQSAEESSVDAWFEGFPEYNDPSRSISYYNKGQILGLLLDLAIRDATDNRKSLDDVMRLMNDRYAKAGKFYNESDGVESAVEEVADRSFKDFFEHYVAGTDEVRYNDFLGLAGLQLEPSPERNSPPYAIIEIPHASERQLRIRDSILRGTTN
jgi:predicted metalloprotease with PDZ domain